MGSRISSYISQLLRNFHFCIYFTASIKVKDFELESLSSCRALPPVAMSTSTSSDPLELVRSTWERKKPDSPIYAFLLDRVAIESATSGTIVAKLSIETNHVNSKGGIHGAVSATIVDWAGGMAIASTGAEKTGVSTDIHISYVNTARVGDVLTIEGRVSKVGRSLAYTSVEIRRGDGAVVCSGLHTKYVG